MAGVAAPKASTLVAPSDPLHVTAGADRFVGRGGHKLDGALAEFSVDVAGRTALDAGASTGGFTDCLLQRGARSVVAVDVGYGQLHWDLRTDPRVTVIERTNLRYLDPAAVGAPFAIVVADLSFISLRVVAPVLAACGDDTSDWLVLVKPQFEVGPDRVPRGGVVIDAGDRADAVAGVVAAFAEYKLAPQGVTASSIKGASGNLEFMLWMRHESQALDPEEVRRRVEEEG